MAKEIYTEKQTETMTQAHDRYIWSEPVPNGKVLQVLNMYGHGHEREAKDRIKLGVKNGATEFLIRARKWADSGEGLSALNPFFVGEYDKLFAYFPDADDTDTIELHIVGVLMDRDDFRLM